MKKILAFIILLSAFSAYAVTTYQMWYHGQWESTVQYSVKPIYGSTTSKTSPVVKDAAGTFVANGASTPIKGIKPESNAAAWDQI